MGSAPLSKNTKQPKGKKRKAEEGDAGIEGFFRNRRDEKKKWEFKREELEFKKRDWR